MTEWQDTPETSDKTGDLSKEMEHDNILINIQNKTKTEREQCIKMNNKGDNWLS